MLDEQKYPIDECKDCIHARVCMFKDYMSELMEKNMVPLNFSTINCDEYMSYSALGDLVSINEDNADDDMADGVEYIDEGIESKDTPSNIMSSINRVLNEIAKRGCKPNSVQMNKATMGIFKQNAPINCILSKKNPGVLLQILTNLGKLKVEQVESVPTGEFHITYY
jgi:hypothetical protein